MAIGIAAKALAKKLLKNKSLKKAINVTTKQTSKLKEAVKVNTKKVKSGADKVKDVYESGVKKETIESAKGKVLRASKKVKSAAKSTVAKATSATAAAAGVVAKKVQEKAKPIVDKAKEKGAKLKRKAERSFTNDSLVDDDGSGNLADFYGIPKSGQSGTFQNDILGGVLASKRAIKNNPKTAIAGAIGTAALTASLLKSSTPKEAEYDIKRMNDGRFSTTFKDANANAVFSDKQLSSKETDQVRSYLAVLDSIILSDDPSKRRNQFLATLQVLKDQYGISNISGKNLSIMLPQG
jgi:hypothetical protein